MTIEQLYHELTEAEALERDAELMKRDAETNLRQSRKRVSDILAKIEQTVWVHEEDKSCTS